MKFSQCVQMNSKVTRFLLPKSWNSVFDMYIVCTYCVFTKIQRLCIFSKNQKYTVPTHCEHSVDCVFDSVFETMYRLCLGRTEFVHSLCRQKYRVHTESFKIFYMFHLVANTTMFTRMIHEIFEHQIRQRSISS